MKKLISGFILGAVLASSIVVSADGSIQAQDASQVKFNINGQKEALESGYTAIMYQDHTYVPARFIAEQLGATVGWDDASQTVIINGAGNNSQQLQQQVTQLQTQNTDLQKQLSTAQTTIQQLQQQIQTLQNQTGSGSTSTTAKSFSEDITITSGPMKMHITKITLDPAYKKDQYSDPINALVFSVTVENTSTGTVSWYPSQGTVVLNTKEQADAGMSLFYSDQVSGDFIGQVVKSGNIAIQVKSDLNQINDIKYQISGASDAKFNRLGSDTLTDIPLN